MSKVRLIFEKQWLHALSLFILTVGIVQISDLSSVRSGHLFGGSSLEWLRISLAIAVAHQFLVWFCWRMQMHLKLLTRIFGRYGFKVYAILFAIFGLARLISILILAIANRDTVPFDPMTLRILSVVMAMPALYLFYSVRRYFGIRRAFGIDHFDESFRSVPFVKQGIFRFTDNGMYIYGFFILWLPGLWYGSAGALFAALFSHIYIWVHYYSTELPDIKRLHGGG